MSDSPELSLFPAYLATIVAVKRASARGGVRGPNVLSCRYFFCGQCAVRNVFGEITG